jgi:hypothetical protein
VALRGHNSRESVSEVITGHSGGFLLLGAVGNVLQVIIVWMGRLLQHSFIVRMGTLVLLGHQRAMRPHPWDPLK